MQSDCTSPGRLFQAIKRLVEATDEVRMSWIHKTWWLGVVHYLRQGPMKKSILDVEPMNRPILREPKRVLSGLWRTWRQDWRSHHNQHLVVGWIHEEPNGPCIYPDYHMQGTYTEKSICPWPHLLQGDEHQVPGEVGEKSRVLFLHGGVPVWIS